MTREKILEVTGKLLKSKGIKGITTRKIAELTGFNAASVNYYFGSKDN
ncbi:TetR/AcrR family transcriptional regulator [Paenibacillus sp. NPDC055715]